MGILRSKTSGRNNAVVTAKNGETRRAVAMDKKGQPVDTLREKVSRSLNKDVDVVGGVEARPPQEGEDGNKSSASRHARDRPASNNNEQGEENEAVETWLESVANFQKDGDAFNVMAKMLSWNDQVVSERHYGPSDPDKHNRWRNKKSARSGGQLQAVAEDGGETGGDGFKSCDSEVVGVRCWDHKRVRPQRLLCFSKANQATEDNDTERTSTSDHQHQSQRTRTPSSRLSNSGSGRRSMTAQMGSLACIVGVKAGDERRASDGSWYVRPTEASQPNDPEYQTMHVVWFDGPTNEEKNEEIEVVEDEEDEVVVEAGDSASQCRPFSPTPSAIEAKMRAQSPWSCGGFEEKDDDTEDTTNVSALTQDNLNHHRLVMREHQRNMRRRRRRRAGADQPSVSPDSPKMMSPTGAPRRKQVMTDREVLNMQEGGADPPADYKGNYFYV